MDIGEKTIGVAVSDEGQAHAFARPTLWRQEGMKRDLAALRQIAAENEIGAIVVGLPLNYDGTPGVQAGKVRAFVQRLRGSVRVPIYEEDERLTTWEAASALDELGHPRTGQKQTIDGVAAALILQTFLDRRRMGLGQGIEQSAENDARDSGGDRRAVEPDEDAGGGADG